MVAPGGPAPCVTLNGSGAGSGRKVMAIVDGGNRGAGGRVSNEPSDS